MIAVVRTAGNLGNWIRSCTRWCHAAAGHGIGSRFRLPSGKGVRWSFFTATWSFRLLQNETLLSTQRTKVLLPRRHTGFSVHTGVRVEPEEKDSLERMAFHILKPPIRLERIKRDSD